MNGTRGRSRLRWIVLTILLMIASQGRTRMSTQRKTYWLQIEAPGMLIQSARLNDIPIAANKSGKISEAGNGILVKGKNVASILFIPAEKKEALAGWHVTATLLTVDEQSSSRQPVGEWHAEKSREPSWPAASKWTFECDDPGGPWCWQQADQVLLSPENQASILQEIKRLYVAFEKRDLASLDQLFRLKMQDQASAFGMDIREVEESYHEGFQNFIFDRTAAPLTPIEPSKIVWTLAADGRLVVVKNATGTDVISTIKDQQHPAVFGIPLFFSRIGGSWKIVR